MWSARCWWVKSTCEVAYGAKGSSSALAISDISGHDWVGSWPEGNIENGWKLFFFRTWILKGLHSSLLRSLCGLWNQLCPTRRVGAHGKYLSSNITCSIILLATIGGTSQLKRSQNISPQILGTIKIKNLAKSNCVMDWGKVGLSRARVGNPPAVLGQGMLN